MRMRAQPRALEAWPSIRSLHGAPPGLEQLFACADNFGPRVRIGAHMITVAHAHFRAHPKFASWLRAIEPADEEILHKGDVVPELSRQRAAAVRHRHLTMLAVERTQ